MVEPQSRFDSLHYLITYYKKGYPYAGQYLPSSFSVMKSK